MNAPRKVSTFAEMLDYACECAHECGSRLTRDEIAARLRPVCTGFVTLDAAGDYRDFVSGALADWPPVRH